MNKRIELLVVRLENENAHAKRLLGFLEGKLSERQVTALLDTINANNDLIEKLKKGL